MTEKTTKEVRLYNAMFPIWLLILFPPFWIIAMIVNYIIDRLVLRHALRRLQIEDIKGKVKKAIWKTWIVGFTSDFVGGLGMVLTALLDFDYNTPFGKWWNENLTNAVTYNPFESIYGVLWTTMCVIITSILIYFINKKWCLKKLELTDEQKKKVALALAIFTAPYLFYLPTAWFW